MSFTMTNQDLQGARFPNLSPGESALLATPFAHSGALAAKPPLIASYQLSWSESKSKQPLFLLTDTQATQPLMVASLAIGRVLLTLSKIPIEKLNNGVLEISGERYVFTTPSLRLEQSPRLAMLRENSLAVTDAEGLENLIAFSIFHYYRKRLGDLQIAVPAPWRFELHSALARRRDPLAPRILKDLS